MEYIGNSAYCYANSASMLLNSIGEKISPATIEVLSGVGIGATYFPHKNLLHFNTIVPDEGVTHALELLGFGFSEKNSPVDHVPPIEQLREDLSHGPVLLGPLDMGHLTYMPNHEYLSGADHFVLALNLEEDSIHLHDPAGYPFVSLDIPQFVTAWKAEDIFDRLYSYHYWFKPFRKHSPTMEQIATGGLTLYKQILTQPKTAEEDVVHGSKAIAQFAEKIHTHGLTQAMQNMLLSFSFQLGARRSLDFSLFYENHHQQFSALKRKKAEQFGQCHSFVARNDTSKLYRALVELAVMEEEIEAVLLHVPRSN